jgi:hypothetical protein
VTVSHHHPRHHDGDAVFRNFQRHNLGVAAQHFAVTVIGQPSFGWRSRSISAPVSGTPGEYWLRVVSDEAQWAQGHGWTGITAAVVLAVQQCQWPLPSTAQLQAWRSASTRCASVLAHAFSCAGDRSLPTACVALAARLVNACARVRS